MTIDQGYYRYLDHFGSVVPVRELAKRTDQPDMIALRHDVDHDLDLALEMAFWEAQRGVRSTYYLLDSAGYWRDPDFELKCRQLGEFGHEVGLHLNALAKWMNGTTSDVESDVLASLRRLRRCGVHVNGVSAHGDPVCYRRQIINYWCLKELRPEDPIVSESGRSAEGLLVNDPSQQIHYPASHTLVREDGAAIPLWNLSMAAMGLSYDAMHIAYDRYFTDSRGAWTRSADPLTEDLSRGRYQILMHPEHWRGPQQIFFFLSAPRSGSMWLSRFLDRATPLTGRHEFTLNHRYRDGVVSQAKVTLDGMNDLITDRDRVVSLMHEARAYVEDQGGDYGEANVYLAELLPELKRVFPDAMLVHLRRDPAQVVRSLVNRDWYDTPEDERHTRLDIKDWDQLGQFEKVCWYVRKTNDLLATSCNGILDFDAIAGDRARLIEQLSTLGIATFPALADESVWNKVNESRRSEFPPFESWTDAQKQTFFRILGPFAQNTGMAGGLSEASTLAHTGLAPSSHDGLPVHNLAEVDIGSGGFMRRYVEFSGRRKSIAGNVKESLRFGREWLRDLRPREHREGYFRVAGKLGGIPVRFWNKGCWACLDAEGLLVQPIEGANTCLVMGGASWYKCGPGKGWGARPGRWYRGEIGLQIGSTAIITLFCLMYDANGALFDKRQLCRLDRQTPIRRFSFRTRAFASMFGLAIHVDTATASSPFRFQRLVLQEILS